MEHVIIGLVTGSQVALLVMFLRLQSRLERKLWDVQSQLANSNACHIRDTNQVWRLAADIEAYLESKGEKVPHPTPPIIRNNVIRDEGVGL